MSAFDIKKMAQGLYVPNAVHVSAKEVIAERLIETAVEIINDPSRSGELLDSMTDYYELDMGMNRVDDSVMQLVTQIKQDNQRAGWDPRVKLKIETKKLSNTFHRLTIAMDLDATIEAMTAKPKRARPRRTTKITDVIEDNPGADLLNEFDRELSSQSESQAKLLPNRYPRFIDSVKNRDGWN